jgi:hypothetical protein
MKAAAIILALLAAAFTSAGADAACDWNNPGRAPLSIPSADALAIYTDIPAAERKDIARRVDALQYDDIVKITPTTIEGSKYAYLPDILDMLWGPGRLCSGIANREGWAKDHVEYAFVYHVKGGGPDIMVAMTCRNPARIFRAPGAGIARTPPPAAEFTPMPPMLGADTPATPPMQLTPPAAAALPPSIPLVLSEPVAAPALPELARNGPAGPTGLPPVFVGGGPVFVPAPVPAIPEPGTWVLWMAGLGALVFKARRRRFEGGQC